MHKRLWKQMKTARHAVYVQLAIFKVFILFSKSFEQITLLLIKNWFWLREHRNCNQKPFYSGQFCTSKTLKAVAVLFFVAVWRRGGKATATGVWVLFWGGGRQLFVPLFKPAQVSRRSSLYHTVTRLCKHAAAQARPNLQLHPRQALPALKPFRLASSLAA